MNTVKTHIQPAELILNQLGGSAKLALVIGAKDFFSDDEGDSLVFKISAKAKNSIQRVKIHLNAMDTYDVTFSKIRYKKDPDLSIRIPTIVNVSEYHDVYADDLKKLIETETGLYLNPFG